MRKIFLVSALAVSFVSMPSFADKGKDDTKVCKKHKKENCDCDGSCKKESCKKCDRDHKSHDKDSEA